MKNIGFNLYRSGTYLQLLTLRPDSFEGKRLINIVPVKLRRSAVYSATIRNLESLASIMGSQQILFISKDVKARIPLGLTAANRKA